MDTHMKKQMKRYPKIELKKAHRAPTATLIVEENQVWIEKRSARPAVVTKVDGLYVRSTFNPHCLLATRVTGLREFQEKYTPKR